MALRIKLSEEVRGRIEQGKRRARLASVAVSAIFVLLGGLVLWLSSILISQAPLPTFIAYVPNEENINLTPKPLMDLVGGASAESPPVSIEIAADIADVALAPMDFSTTFTGFGGGSMGGMAGLGEGGVGSGYGDGKGTGMGSAEKTGSSFCGRFWDLKKTPGGTAGPYRDVSSNGRVMDMLSRFYKGGWNPSDFSACYESKVKLYTNCFYMPNCMDNEATNAYDPKGRMKLEPSRWVALYRAKVKAPASGRFRFVGAGDSVMGVRFAGRNVLQCGFHSLETGEWDANLTDDYQSRHDFFAYKGCEAWNEMFGGFQAGEIFTVEEGQWYDMEVLVSEIGGGAFGFCLLLDDVDGEKKKDAQGQPLFQVFRTSFVEPDADEIYAGMKYKDEQSLVRPPYDPDSMVWEAKPVGAK